MCTLNLSNMPWRAWLKSVLPNIVFKLITLDRNHETWYRGLLYLKNDMWGEGGVPYMLISSFA